MEIFVIAVVGAVGLLLCLATYRLVRDRQERADYLATVRAIRWWMVPVAVAHVAVLVSGVVLLLSAFPLLRVGWWMLLGGSGNVALGQTGRGGVRWDAVAVAVPIWLFVLVPLLAYREELSFRYGSEENSPIERMRRQIVFGLGHAVVMGVPIGAGVVLVGSGMLYQRVYLTTLNRLLSQTELASWAKSPECIDFPSTPQGPYDPSAWQAHHREVDRVIQQNRQLSEQWFETAKAQDGLRQRQIADLRAASAAKAAALHTVTNWLVVGPLIAYLFLKAI